MRRLLEPSEGARPWDASISGSKPGICAAWARVWDSSQQPLEVCREEGQSRDAVTLSVQGESSVRCGLCSSPLTPATHTGLTYLLFINPTLM